MKRASVVVIFVVVLGIVLTSEAAPPQAIPTPLPQPPVGEPTAEFRFFLAGVSMPDRVVGFFRETGGYLNYWCGSCSFAVGEFAIANAQMDLGPGIVFKLSQDGAVLTATCKSSACNVTIGEESRTVSGKSFSANLKSLKNSETIDIPTKARALFTVKK
jgi:hypothetical protein